MSLEGGKMTLSRSEQPLNVFSEEAVVKHHFLKMDSLVANNFV